MSNLANGNVVYYAGKYWATPEYASILANENVVWEHDIAKDGGAPVKTYDTLRDYTFIEKAKEWVTENELYERNICFCDYSFMDVGFYYGWNTLLYKTPSIPVGFIQSPVAGTYDGIQIKVENGKVLFYQDDLLKLGIYSKPITELVGVHK